MASRRRRRDERWRVAPGEKPETHLGRAALQEGRFKLGMRENHLPLPPEGPRARRKKKIS